MNTIGILENRNLFAGKIMDGLSHDVLRSSINELFEAIEIRDAKLDKPFVLVCGKNMSKALKNIYPNITCIDEEDIGLIDNDTADELVCIVTDDKAFPEHYIVLSDLENIKGFILGDISSPHSALLAVKGFKAPEINKESVIVYAASNIENIVWDIIGQIAETEFSEKEHDSLNFITIYSDFMLYSLINLGFVSGETSMFLGKVLVKVSYNFENRGKILLSFKSGKTIMLVAEKEDEVDMKKEEEKQTNKGDMVSLVLDGLFGK